MQQALGWGHRFDIFHQLYDFFVNFFGGGSDTSSDDEDEDMPEEGESTGNDEINQLNESDCEEESGGSTSTETGYGTNCAEHEVENRSSDEVASNPTQNVTMVDDESPDNERASSELSGHVSRQEVSLSRPGNEITKLRQGYLSPTARRKDLAQRGFSKEELDKWLPMSLVRGD
ncbi:hypothetical protein PHYPSEUDO_014987 [Phytophthora pseudosyringae]|uniref:Uncharacterized protein n=1 Tax=Phytophthora pseudosyringae TaxID=221518 RepID=A0A8T1WLK3_9STRA|nr:hypothetical protein PHYPSEUDO_014987 [Phytophthora pseudosyringae]